MKKYIITFCLSVFFITSYSALLSKSTGYGFAFRNPAEKSDTISSWIRINQLGYLPSGVKVAVWASKQNEKIKDFKVIDTIYWRLRNIAYNM